MGESWYNVLCLCWTRKRLSLCMSSQREVKFRFFTYQWQLVLLDPYVGLVDDVDKNTKTLGEKEQLHSFIVA